MSTTTTTSSASRNRSVSVYNLTAHSDFYSDFFCRMFTNSSEFVSFMDTQNTIDADTQWEVFETRSAVFTPVDNSNLSGIPANVVSDTRINTGLTVTYTLESGLSVTRCINACATPSIFGTGRVSGKGPMELPDDKLALLLTWLFSTSPRSKSYAMYRGGKVCAVFSSRYEYIPIAKMLEAICSLSDMYGVPEFVRGQITHSSTYAELAFPECSPVMTQTYNGYLAAANRPTRGSLCPVIALRSSDTSTSSARLSIYLRDEADYGRPLTDVSVRHCVGNEQGLARFVEECNGLFSLAADFMRDKLPKMLNTPIDHPTNVLIGLLNPFVPMKFGCKAEAHLNSLLDASGKCSFLEIYESMAVCTASAIRAGVNPQAPTMYKMEEGIAKIIRNPACWTRFDYPGTMSWTISD